MVKANQKPLKYLLRNSTTIYKLQTNLCPLSIANPTNPDPISLTTLRTVIDEMVEKLNQMLPYVTEIMGEVDLGAQPSDFGLVGSSREDFDTISNLTSHLQEYLAHLKTFEEDVRFPMLWLYGFPALPSLGSPIPSKDLSLFLCIIWMCDSRGSTGEQVPPPWSIQAGNDPTFLEPSLIEVDTEGRRIFQMIIRNLQEILERQDLYNTEFRVWIENNIDEQKYDFSGLLPQWWKDSQGETIEAVFFGIRNWFVCWREIAPLNAIIGALDDILPLELYFPVSQGTTLVSRPAGGWPWES
ncbi:hypothetical protein TWF730_003828 [Orbilia blumenaviensis]|uniref:Uncharacterized protein n=1 Tax=Orbilia blumenaviensis TaxID=1796055 RepID=A0AAV9U3B8_9PEZI